MLFVAEITGKVLFLEVFQEQIIVKEVDITELRDSEPTVQKGWYRTKLPDSS